LYTGGMAMKLIWLNWRRPETGWTPRARHRPLSAANQPRRLLGGPLEGSCFKRRSCRARLAHAPMIRPFRPAPQAVRLRPCWGSSWADPVTAGRSRSRVRRALLFYALKRLGLDVAPDSRPPQVQHIVLVTPRSTWPRRRRSRDGTAARCTPRGVHREGVDYPCRRDKL